MTNKVTLFGLQNMKNCTAPADRLSQMLWVLYLYTYLLSMSIVINDETARILPIAKCKTDADLRISTIRSGTEYSFQDTVTTFHTIPANNSEISVTAFTEPEKTDSSIVEINRKESALTP